MRPISVTHHARQGVRVCLLTFMALSFTALSTAVAQNARTAQAVPPAEEPELPHPFFTHMGLPEGVGNFNLRTLGLMTRADGQTESDFALHLETGITPSVGLHVRNDRALNNDWTEAMFQFATFVSKDGMSGFAPIIEVEIPTRSGASRVNTLVGFTTSLGSSRVAFNQVLHYDPREDAIDASAALVVAAGRRVFPMLEVLGEAGEGMPAVASLLAGVKVRVRDWLMGGVAIEFPMTTARDFSSRVSVGPDLEWTR